ncbi:MAG: hypothetical protein GY765_34190 [bacterium]|nr:hypothetical protein [bacterium]
MNKNTFRSMTLLVFFIFAVSTALTFAAETPAAKTSVKPAAEHLRVYYFHTTHRCDTCRKIEKYTAEAIKKHFADELGNGKLVFSPVNIDEDANKHFVADYKIYTKHVIVSKVSKGKELKWKNLDRIWELVGGEAEFKTYIVKETRSILTAPEK